MTTEMEESCDIDEKQHAYELLQELHKSDNRHFDFIIKIGGEEIPVHKNILSAASDYFKAMLSHDTIETRSGCVEMKEVDHDCVRKCINFIYTGKAAVSPSNRQSLMYVAHMLQLQKLCDAIAARLKKSLNPKSFFDTKKLANMYNCEGLGKECNEFAKKFFQDIAQYDEFMELDEEYISSLLESNDTKASEAIKCKSAIKWVAHEKSRRKLLMNFIGKLDLKEIPLSQRRFLVENEPLVYDSAACLKRFTVSILDSIEVKPEEIKYERKERYENLQCNGAIAVFNKTANTLDAFDPTEKSLTTLMDLAENTHNKGNFSAVEMDGYIYVLFHDKKTFRINCNDFTWEQVADKNLPYGQAVVHDGLVYAIAIENFNAASECYDPATNTWCLLEHRKTEVAYPTLTATEDGVFCIGGFRQQRPRFLRKVELFNPATATWSTDSVLCQARNDAAATVLDKKIYVMGGKNREYLNTCEVRCPTTKVWTTLTPMKYFRSGFIACLINKKIYALCGNSQTNANDIEEYDPEKNEWKVCGDLGNIEIEKRASVAITI